MKYILLLCLIVFPSNVLSNEDCFNLTYDRGKRAYERSDWEIAYVNLFAAGICFVTVEMQNKKRADIKYAEEITSARDYARNQLFNKNKTVGFSLNGPPSLSSLKEIRSKID